MKTIKKLLCTLVALTLVFCSLSSVMTVSAKDETSEWTDAFSSITIGGKKVDWSDGDAPEVELTTKTAVVKVKVKSGWKLKKISFHNGKKTVTVKNGGTIKSPRNYDSYVRFKATKGKKKDTVTVYVYRE